jgi:3-hydroxyisobutyrate dehydrogenase-like beta-hydroxyacid dehydrogenase
VKVGLLHPGEMGAAVGAVLVERGDEVLWRPAGRSAATARRAEEAGLQATEHFDDVQVILSICPPHAALDVARTLAGSRALVIDANAVSPATARAIGAVLGDNWVDGGIVGPPPRSSGTTRLYLSGTNAGAAAELFTGTPMEAIVVSGSPVAASALKMAYAAWTKGTAALLLAIRATAKASGIEEALLTEWARSQPELEVRAQNAAISAATKGWRWAGEMDEIAATFAETGLPVGFHEAATAIFRRSPQLAEPSLDGVIDGLLAQQDDV